MMWGFLFIGYDIIINDCWFGLSYLYLFQRTIYYYDQTRT